LDDVGEGKLFERALKGHGWMTVVRDSRVTLVLETVQGYDFTRSEA
jgi:hypothetical protein